MLQVQHQDSERQQHIAGAHCMTHTKELCTFALSQAVSTICIEAVALGSGFSCEL